MGRQICINAQLIDAETDKHLWAERFDGDTSDLFALQDEITSRIAVTLGIELIRAEAARQVQHPDALDYTLRGRAILLSKLRTRDTYAERTSIFERALALDPESVEAQGQLAAVLAGRVMDNMTGTAAADILRAQDFAGRALVAAPHSGLAHYAKGQVLRAQRRFAEAIPEYETVLGLDRNFVRAFLALGQSKLYTGSIEEVIPLMERAIRLSPRDPNIGRFGLVHLLQSRTDEATIWLEKARNADAAHANLRPFLASAYALAGESERGAAELAEARRLSLDDRYSSLARLRAVGYWGVPKIHALFEATYFAGLRKAGMPEE